MKCSAHQAWIGQCERVRLIATMLFCKMSTWYDNYNNKNEI